MNNRQEHMLSILSLYPKDSVSSATRIGVPEFKMNDGKVYKPFTTLVNKDGKVILIEDSQWGGQYNIGYNPADDRDYVIKGTCEMVNDKHKCMILDTSDDKSMVAEHISIDSSVYHMYCVDGRIDIQEDSGGNVQTFDSLAIRYMIEDGTIRNIYDVVKVREKLRQKIMHGGDWLIMHVDEPMYTRK